MPKSEFVYVTYIKTTPDKLWNAITHPGFMKQYWFGMHCESDWKTGSPWKMVSETGQIVLESNIQKLYDRSRGNLILVLCPRLEEWIVRAVQDTGRKMEHFGLSDDGKKLYQEFSIQPKQLEKAIKEILPVSNHLKTLKKYLEEKP